MFFGVDKWQGDMKLEAPRLPRVEATRTGTDLVDQTVGPFYRTTIVRFASRFDRTGAR